MATYKKRGYKPKTKAEKEELLGEGSATAEVFNTLDVGASKTEAWIEKNQKMILGFVGVVAICVLGYLAYQQFIQKPNEIEAMNEMYQAQSYYDLALTASAKDSLFNLSLNGGAGKYGFLDIIDNYGSTSAGNMARYYAGMAYINTNNYQDAIEHLDKFKSDDEMLGPLAKGAIGDAFVQLGQNEEALKYYEKSKQILNKNKHLKKYAKMLTFYKGMKSVEKAAFGATYKTVWCAGPSIEFVKSIRSVQEIVNDLMKSEDDL